jgi:hypothetical protein
MRKDNEINRQNFVTALGARPTTEMVQKFRCRISDSACCGGNCGLGDYSCEQEIIFNKPGHHDPIIPRGWNYAYETDGSNGCFN